MFKFLSKFMKKDPKENCVHEWHDLGKEYVYEGITPDSVEEGHIIYCPKCQGEMTVTKKTWERIQKKMEIDAQHYAEEVRRSIQEEVVL